MAAALADQATLFGVANIVEARELRASGITHPIVLLGTCLPEEMEIAVREGWQVSISSLEEATALNEIAKQISERAAAHVVLDTGMGRMGFLVHDWNAETIQSLKMLSHIEWEGLASHFPAADGSDDDAAFTCGQIARFRESVDMARVSGLQPRWIHLSNSAGMIGYHEARGLCNLARPGLMLYGVSPMDGEWSNLRPALTWKTRVLLVRELPADHGVSYGRSFTTKRPTWVATLACGYADGYPRQLSGQGADVLIHGLRCPILGRVTMDQIMVDVTDLPLRAQVGDEAVLLGAQGAAAITATELAQKAGTIAWHIFTSIGERVQRVHF